jgi:hypothetical protein
MTQLFYIRSAQSPNYVLNGQGGDPSKGQSIITWTKTEGFLGGANELWILQNQQMEIGPNNNGTSFQMPQYTIASAGNPDIVFDLGPEINGAPSVVLADKVSGKASQIWALQPGTIPDQPRTGLLVNTSNNQALTASDYGPDVPLVTSGQPISPTGYNWQIEPSAVPINQPTSIQCMQFGLQSPQVITIEINKLGTFADPSGALSVAPMVGPTKANPTWPTNAIWLYTLDGLIVSSANPQLVLTWCIDGIYALPRQPSDYNSLQQWIVVASPGEWSDGTHTFQYTRLTISPASQPDQYLVLNSVGGLTIESYSSAAADNGSMYWANGSGYPLETIMAQPPLLFPTGPSDNPQYAASYNYISTNVIPIAPFGIRTMYTTSNQEQLASYYTAVSTMEMPSSITDPEAWNAVVAQLGLELPIAAAIQGNYAVMSNLAGEMKSGIKDSVSTLTALIGTSLGNVTGSLATLGEGLVLAGINLIPTFGGAIATLLQTGINLATTNGTIQVSRFEMAAANLQDSINATFDALEVAIAAQQTAILSDWGKMQALNHLLTLPSWHPDSLYLSDDGVVDLATGIGCGAEVAILQYLMPAAFKIWRWYNMTEWPSSSVPPDMPGWAWYKEDRIANTFDLCLVAKGKVAYDGGWSSVDYPSQDVMNRIWALGVQPLDFYSGSNGWDGFGVQPCDVGKQWVANGEDNQMRGGWCNILLGTIQNCTQNSLEVKVSPNHDCDLSWNTETVTLSPNGIVTYALLVGDHNDTSANVYVWDPNYSSTDWVLLFEMVGGEDGCYMNGPSTTRDNYALTPASQYGHTYDANDGPPDQLTVWIVQN